MAVRMDADGKDYTYSLALGTQAALTVAGWFKISVDRDTYSTIFFIDNGTSDNWGMQTAVDGTTMSGVFDASTQENMGSLTVGTWYFICLATNGTTGSIYHRTPSAAALTTVGVTSVTASVNAATLRLGESPWGGEWLNGCMASVRVWNAQLTAAEALQESQQYTPSRFTNLVAWYPFVRTDTLDYSGNGRTLSGGTGTTVEDGPPIPWRLAAPRLLRTVSGGGGTTYPVSLSGTVTPAAGLVRQTSHLTAGSISPAGAAAKRLSRVFAGTSTPSGAAVKLTARTVAGATSPAGLLTTIRTRLVALAGTVTPVGVVTRQLGKPAAGAVTPAGAVGKRVSKPLAGAVSPAGVVATIRTRLLAVVGSVTPFGLLARQTGKTVGGGTAPAGAVSRSLSRRLTGTVTPAAVLSSTRTKILAIAGAITPAGAVIKRAARALSGSVTPAGSVTKRIGHLVAGVVSPSSAVLKLVGRVLAGGLTPSGSVATDTNIAPTVTPPERTLTVGAEPRVLAVAVDNRTVAIPTEPRTLEA